MNVQHDPKEQKFFITVDDGEAVLNYHLKEGVIEFAHTYVPSAYRGKGYAEAVVKAGFEYARAKKLKVIPSCPYVPVYLERHPEYQSLTLS